MDQTIRRKQSKIMSTQIINAWKQATEYLKKNKQHIHYAEHPEPEPPETNRKRPNRQLRQYKDKIMLEGKKQDLNQGEKIQPTEYTRKMRKTYRDTARKRKNELKYKYQIHGKIRTLNKTWNNRKLEEEAKTLLEAAERNNLRPIWNYQKNCGTTH